MRPALPLAAAALLVLILRSPVGNGGRQGDAGQRAALNAAENALIADVSDAEFAQLVCGGSGHGIAAADRSGEVATPGA